MSLIFTGEFLENRGFQELGKLEPQRMAMVVDVDRCIRCYGCEVACSIEKRLLNPVRLNPLVQSEPRQIMDRVVLLNFSLRCVHCEDAACVRVCPTNAFRRTPEGIVVQVDGRCVGCGLCQFVCPYGAPKYDPETRHVLKCDFCVERVRRGESPACVAKCIMGAIQFGRLKDLLPQLAECVLEEKGTLVLS